MVRLPANSPCVLIAQHMPPVFTKSFAERLNALSQMRVSEAQGGEEILPGHAYVAPGGFHMIIEKDGNTLRTALTSDDKVHFQRPAIDVLFNAIAVNFDGHIAGTILTGMGRDGADGLLALKHAGASCSAQDEETSVVYGMPKVAAEIGAADTILPVQDIAEHLIQALLSKQFTNRFTKK